MSFRLVPKLVTLNDPERRNCRYFSLFQQIFVYDVILYNHIKTICAIIQRLFGQNEVITGFDGVRE